MSGTSRGRADLAAWLEGQPSDLYEDDAAAQSLVNEHGLEQWSKALHHAGRVVAGPLHTAAVDNNLHRNLPELDTWDAIGRRTAQVRHHPSWTEAGRLIYGTGIMAAYAKQPVPHRAILTLFYLTAQAGEAGHNCPLACAAGAIRTLQALGTPEQQRRYLAPLLDPDFETNFTASQFLTEVQGGSDVGANALRAVPLSEQTGGGSPWSLHGEKWFCSNADADVFVMTARPEGAAAGTRGLGLFLVPRVKPDGSLNAFRIRRLKDKLGTRSMASAELDFEGAYAEALGPVGDGFASVMSLVITTSRLFNAAGCAAHARRAWVIASTYAQHRQAFGQPIGRFAQVRETLAQMRASATAGLTTTLWLAGLLERIEAGQATAAQAAFFRVAVNLNKLDTAIQAHQGVNQGIEVLGGNGAIESFSILPRLLRDNVVYENWEGTHNVLRAQVLRDCARLGLHEGFFAVLEEYLGEDALVSDRDELAAILAAPGDLSELRFRALCARLVVSMSLAALSQQPALGDVALMTERRLGRGVLDERYLQLIDRLQR
jgi:acyl-CoA dehydrogenase